MTQNLRAARRAGVSVDTTVLLTHSVHPLRSGGILKRRAKWYVPLRCSAPRSCDAIEHASSRICSAAVGESAEEPSRKTKASRMRSKDASLAAASRGVTASNACTISAACVRARCSEIT